MTVRGGALLPWVRPAAAIARVVSANPRLIAALRPGQIAEVRQIAGRMEQIRRLEELGVRDGVIVEVVRAGTPCIIRVGGTRLCFRDGELCSVMVAARKSA